MVITILLAFFLPLAALMVVLSAPVCQAVARATIPYNAANPAEHEHLVEVALAVRDFSLGNNAAPMPVGDDHRVAITPDAIQHLLDVRLVFVLSEIAFALLLVALLVFMIVSVRRSRAGLQANSKRSSLERSQGSSLAFPLIIGGALPLAGAALLGLAIAIDFGAFFDWMHGIFFADGTWTFPADSLLIRSLPNAFWAASAAVWAASMAVLCLISIAVGLILAQRSKQRLAHAEGAQLK
ncbi:MAG: DUF1461 domain-containing protein [Coriobacteriia bacterium]|nr:DUF1461 domain-containing protein [Coriobacteriia bacterium]